MKTALAHLREARRRALRLLFLFSALFLASLYFSPDVIKHLARGFSLVAVSPFEVVLVELRVAFVLALVLSLPAALFEAAAFARPALRKREAWILRALPLVSLLFFAGAAFGYLVVVRYGLDFMAQQADLAGVVNMWSAGSTLSFILFVSVAMGFVFQLPLLVFFLSGLGLVTREGLSRQRRYLIIWIFVFAAVITPTTDPVTMLLVALPLWALFEGSVFLLRFV